MFPYKISVLILLLLVPFLHAFGIIGWLSLPMLFFLVVFPFAFINGRLKYSNHDIFLVIMLVVGLISSLLSEVNISIKTINYFLAWSISIFLFYFVMCNFIIKSKLDFNKLGIYFFYGLIIASTGVLLDLYLANIQGYYLSDIIHYSFGDSVREVSKTFSGAIFRPRGLASEPGFTAIVYELFLPLGLFHLWFNIRSLSVKIIFSLFFVGAYLILTSAASLVSIFASISILVFINNKYNYKFIFIAAALVAMFYNQVEYYIVSVIMIKLDLLFSGESLRYDIYSSAIDLFISSPIIGIGFGSLSNAFQSGQNINGIQLFGAGAINLYLEVLIFGGFLAWASFLLFLWSVVRIANQYRNFIEVHMLMVSFFSISLHHMFISEVWFPMLWIVCALITTLPYLVLFSNKQRIS
jgi:hypothetical protein